MTWTSKQIRKTFLDHYANLGHRRIGSLSLVPPEDPTLLFVNAGMVQFKDVFTGARRVDYTKACSSQKCLRVSGKHNDLENVGRTARHHTFFEMLGNFSFGEYFKEGAIASAWDLLVNVYGLPVESLYVTVHPDDDDARKLWLKISGLPAERVLDDPDNFWSMGETGPCGPCSEIHIDQGPALSGGKEVPFGEGGDRYLEIWNLVFMQYDRDAEGNLTPLPSPSIDTGMGLERVTAILQGKVSNYDSDLFEPLIATAARLANVTYGTDPDTDTALRVIADHARATAFLIADGIYPENEGRGYVIRRVMRRAMRFGRKLGLEGPFLRDVCATVVTHMKSAYPDLEKRADVIQTMVTQEEERFGRTLATGLKRLEEAFKRDSSTKVIPGEIAFELYDTHGFPVDLTSQAAAERGYSVDVDGFEAAMTAQREKGRASWKGGVQASGREWEEVRAEVGETEFVGYTTDSAQTTVSAVLDEGDGLIAVVVDKTPFYPEGGGQVGDTGLISTENTNFRVRDTRSPLDGLTVHFGHFEDDAPPFERGASVTLNVNSGDRDNTRKNHSATHLLHYALRAVLGDHVKQRGSLVGPHRLRFDFSHFGPMTAEEIAQVEHLVNERILLNVPAETDVVSKDEATSRGAIAFFGDKYGDTVRMVTLTGDSVELCGGTHVQATGDVGLFKVTAESSLAAGVRRVDAVTGLDALKWVQNREAILANMAATLKVGVSETPSRLTQLTQEIANLRRDLEKIKAVQRSAGVADAQPEDVDGVQVLVLNVKNVKGSDLRDMSDKARTKLGSGIVLLCSQNDEKVALLIAVTPDLVDKFPAGKLIGKLAPVVGGRGGGRPDMAQAGGSKPEAIPQLGEELKAVVRQGEVT